MSGYNDDIPGPGRAGQGPAAQRRYAVDHRLDGYELRTMTTADLDVVYALEQRLFPDDAWPRDMFDAELAQPETRDYFVATIGGTVVGYAGLMCVAPVADVQTIAVIPECEGKGIGSALLRTLLNTAVERGGEDILLEVRDDNSRAHGLYEHFGFVDIARRKNYYRGGHDAIVMRRDLPRRRQSPGAIGSEVINAVVKSEDADPAQKEMK